MDTNVQKEPSKTGQDPGGPPQGQTDMTLTRKESTFAKGKVTRENTKTEVQSLGMGKRTATLYLSRTHTNMRTGRNSTKPPSRLAPADTTMTSRQQTQLAEEDELIEAIGLKKDFQREFTFTGYDIMEDNATREVTPADMDQHDKLKRNYQQTYERSCRMMGVHPVQPIAQSLADSHVVLKTRGLGVQGARAIAIALVGNQCVQSLELEDNWIGPEGATSLAQMLQANHVITELNIAENRIGTKGIRAIAELLTTNTTLVKLDVSGSNLFDHDAKFIAMILENNYKLRELRVRHNKLGELGGLYLGPAIASNDTLEVLDLSWNHLRGKGAMAVAAGVQVNAGLRVLNISWNGFAADSCKVLGQSLRDNNMLRELDISNNRLDAEAVGGLMKGVQANDTLTTLRMGNNPLTPDLALVVLKAIDKWEDSQIVELDLENVVVDQEFVNQLEETKKKRFMICQHGRVIKKGQSMVKEGEKISAFMDPVQALYEYMSEKAYRVIDLFKRFDADRSMSVTREEFAKGLISANVPLTVGQLEDLMEQLDKNKDGEVDLKELIEGEKLFRRKLMRKKLRKASMESNRSTRAGSLPDILEQARRRSSMTGLHEDKRKSGLPPVRE